MAKFGISFQGFVTATSLKTIGKITSIAAKPFEMIEYAMFGAGSVSPADTQHEAQAMFLTAAGAGTSTAQTPEKFAQSSAAASCTAGVNYTVEPTTYNTVSPVQFSFNQRGGFRWSVPLNEGLKDQFENTAMHLGFRVRSHAVGATDFNAMWWEQ